VSDALQKDLQDALARAAAAEAALVQEVARADVFGARLCEADDAKERAESKLLAAEASLREARVERNDLRVAYSKVMMIGAALVHEFNYYEDETAELEVLFDKLQEELDAKENLALLRSGYSLLHRSAT
jgi:chromosome segregation ATPase